MPAQSRDRTPTGTAKSPRELLRGTLNRAPEQYAGPQPWVGVAVARRGNFQPGRT
jgi:hypothetical protein